MKRNKFNLSHYKQFTGSMGELIPIQCIEVLPGDTFRGNTSVFMRVSPLLAPVMHPVKVRIHHWFCPNRFVWEDWEDFCTGGEDGTFTATYPHFKKATITEGSLHDYLGIPPASYGGGSEVYFSALPSRIYAKIFNEYYRDQDLVTELTIDETSGEDTTTNETLQFVAWEKDYFTASRPFEQKGDEITIPLLGEAPIFGDSMDYDNAEDNDNIVNIMDQAGAAANIRALKAGTFVYAEDIARGDGVLKADLEEASGISINDLRLASALQKFQERMATGGSRYVEYLRTLGVRSSDYRMGRPVYLGGGRQTIQFSEVVQMGPDYDANEGVGALKGHGVSAMRTRTFQKFFEEHGYIMTLMSVVPKAIYAQGLHRGFKRTIKEDYFQPELARIGEQVVTNEEVYTEHTTPTGTFSYQARYDEYRSHPSSIAGEFRSSLDHWHLARIFASDPSLNSSFVTCSPSNRIYASSETDQLICTAFNNMRARRMLPVRAKPGVTI